MKEKILEKSKQMNLTLTDNEFTVIEHFMTMIASFSNEQEIDKQLNLCLKAVKPGRKMSELLDKGIEIEYSDGSKEALH